MVLLTSEKSKDKKIKLRKDVKVLSKKVKNKVKPKKLAKTPESKLKKNFGQIAAVSKIEDKAWKKTIQALSQQNLAPVLLEILNKFKEKTVPRTRKKHFVQWVVTELKLKKEKYLSSIEELYALLQSHFEAEKAKLKSEKNVVLEHKSRRQKLREKKLKKKLKKQLKVADENSMQLALEEAKSKIEFVMPKKNLRKHKKKNFRQILKETKMIKMQKTTGSNEMEVDGDINENSLSSKVEISEIDKKTLKKFKRKKRNKEKKSEMETE